MAEAPSRCCLEVLRVAFPAPLKQGDELQLFGGQRAAAELISLRQAFDGPAPWACSVCRRCPMRNTVLQSAIASGIIAQHIELHVGTIDV